MGSPSTAGERPPHTGSALDQVNEHGRGAYPFDSSMGLTLLVILAVLVFIAAYSIYIRRNGNNRARNRDRNTAATPRRNRVIPPQFTTGLDPATVESLPTASYSDKEPTDDCAICLAEFEEGETVRIIPYCHHEFHPKCIDTWLVAHASCPVCRSRQLFPAGEVCLGVAGGGGDGDGGVALRSTADV